MKLGFIGLGNLTTFITTGLRRSSTFRNAEIYGYDVSPAQSEKAKKQLGILPCRNIAEVAKACDLLILAVKPHIVQNVLTELRGALNLKQIVISAAAGRDLAFLMNELGEEQPILRLMPNINAQVGMSTNAYCCNAAVTEEQRKKAEEFLSAFGVPIAAPESMFPLYTVITGATPAFAFMFIDALAKAAVACGMSRPQAIEAVATTLMGSAKTVLDSGIHPIELADRVCSPAGVTIEGVLQLQKHGFEASLEQAVEAAYAKNKKI